MTCKLAPEVVCKTSAETRRFEMDFTDDLAATETITSVVFSDNSAGDITRTFPAVSGAKVQVRIAGGTLGKTWLITATLLTSANPVIVGQGRIAIT